MRIYKGNTIAQYAIIILLVGIVVSQAFSLVGINLVDIFSKYKDGYSDMSSKMSVNANEEALNVHMGNIKAGDYNGSYDNPEKRCFEGVCAIDFGTVVLNNVPQNFSEIVETTGTSGATETIIAMIEQLKDQVAEDPANTEEVVAIQKLIDRGMEIVKIEKEYDSFMSNYIASIDGFVNAKIENGLYDDNQVKYIKDPACSASGDWKNQYGTYCPDIPIGKNDQAYLDMAKAINSQYKDMLNSRSATRSLVTDENSVTVPNYTRMYMLLDPTAVLHVDPVTNKIDFMVSKDPFDTHDHSIDKYLDGTLDINAYQGSLDGIPEELKTTGSFVTSPVSYFLTELKDVMAKTNDPAVETLTKQLAEEVLKLSARSAETQKTVNNYIWSGKTQYENYEDSADPVADTTRLDLILTCSSHGGEFDDKTGACIQ